MKKTRIIIHHSTTIDGRLFDWASIRRYHTSYRINYEIVTPEEFKHRKDQCESGHFEEPWVDIGYHWGLEIVNGCLEVVQGRPTDDDGAHCYGLNTTAIGICCVGNFDQEAPSPELLKKLRDFIHWLRQLYGIPVINVIGHREAQVLLGMPPDQRKTCPGAMFDMDALRAML